MVTTRPRAGGETLLESCKEEEGGENDNLGKSGATGGMCDEMGQWRAWGTSVESEAILNQKIIFVLTLLLLLLTVVVINPRAQGEFGLDNTAIHDAKPLVHALDAAYC